MRKPRQMHSIKNIRGGQPIMGRVPFRRISVELPESLWAKLKQVGAETHTPISRLICDAATDRYGRASEAEILLLYQQMSGIPEEEIETNEPTPAPKPEPIPVQQTLIGGTFGAFLRPSATVATQKISPPAKEGLKKSAAILLKATKKP